MKNGITKNQQTGGAIADGHQPTITEGALVFVPYVGLDHPAGDCWAWYGGVPMSEHEIRANARHLIKTNRWLDA
jgi:hypothetical protein